MPIIEWNDSLCLGVQQFDEHHRHLVGLINQVYKDLTADEPSEHLSDVLSELIEYTIYHFAAEEYWMNENSYPKLAEHIAEHDMFSGRVVEMQKDFRAGRITPNLEVHTFLKSWLTNHILQTDADYGRFISAT
jgi:hemerythrin